MNEQRLHQDQITIDEHFLQENRGHFFAILEQLRYNCNKPLDAQADRLLAEVWTFFSRRFDKEKKAMQQFLNPVFEIHLQQHLFFLDNLDWSIETIRKNKIMTQEFCDFLSQWVELHDKMFDRDLCENKIRISI